MSAMNETKALEALRDIMEMQGCDPTMWTGAGADAARALLDHSAAARAELAAGQALEAALEDFSGAPPPAAPAALRQAILDIPHRYPRANPGAASSPSLPWAARLAVLLGFAPSSRPFAAGAGFALATLMLGFFLGYGGLVPLPGEGEGPLADLVDELSVTEELQ